MLKQLVLWGLRKDMFVLRPNGIFGALEGDKSLDWGMRVEYIHRRSTYRGMSIQ